MKKFIRFILSHLDILPTATFIVYWVVYVILFHNDHYFRTGYGAVVVLGICLLAMIFTIIVSVIKLIIIKCLKVENIILMNAGLYIFYSMMYSLPVLFLGIHGIILNILNVLFGILAIVLTKNNQQYFN